MNEPKEFNYIVEFSELLKDLGILCNAHSGPLSKGSFPLTFQSCIALDSKLEDWSRLDMSVVLSRMNDIVITTPKETGFFSGPHAFITGLQMLHKRYTLGDKLKLMKEFEANRKKEVRIENQELSIQLSDLTEKIEKIEQSTAEKVNAAVSAAVSVKVAAEVREKAEEFAKEMAELSHQLETNKEQLRRNTQELCEKLYQALQKDKVDIQSLEHTRQFLGLPSTTPPVDDAPQRQVALKSSFFPEKKSVAENKPGLDLNKLMNDVGEKKWQVISILLQLLEKTSDPKEQHIIKLFIFWEFQNRSLFSTPQIAAMLSREVSQHEESVYFMEQIHQDIPGILNLEDDSDIAPAARVTYTQTARIHAFYGMQELLRDDQTAINYFHDLSLHQQAMYAKVKGHKVEMSLEPYMVSPEDNYLKIFHENMENTTLKATSTKS